MGIKAAFKRLPLHARHTFYYDLRSGIFFGIFGGLFFPFMAVVGRKIGATDQQIALLIAAPYIANAFALLWTEDILGKGRIWYVVWPNAAGRALLSAMFFAVTPAWYVGLIFIYMLVTAPAFPSYASVMKTNYPDAFRARLMSYVRVGIALMWILASAIGGWYLERSTSNYKYLFPLAAVFGAISALQFRRVKVRNETKKREPLSALSGLSRPFKDKRFLSFLIVYSLFEFSILLSTPVFPLVLVDEVGISNWATGLYGSIFSSMWLAGFFIWGRFMDKHSEKTTLVTVFLISCAVPLLYLVSRSVIVLGAAQAVAGVLFAAVELIGYVMITRMAGPRDVPRYMAAHVAVGGLRGAVAPFLGTSVYSIAGGAPVFAASVVLSLMAAVLTARLARMSSNI